MPTPTLADETQLLRRNTQTSFAEVTAHLLTHLGPTMTAALATKDIKTVRRYAENKTAVPFEVETALRHAHRIFTYLELVDAPPTVRAWFMGMNPQLDDHSPLEVLMEGRHQDVLAAAKAFVTGG